MNQDSNNQRLEKTTACLPIVYGSVAFYLGKKIADEFQTHQWTLYIRGPNNEDLSSCISKVIFQLHPSFAQPVREISSPPFEVCEKGWGEFEAQIRIVWNDPSEQSVILNHFIKLYPPPGPNQDPAVPTLTEPDVPVLAEAYDEVVFTNPTESFFRKLQTIPISLPTVYSQQQHFLSYSDSDSFQALLAAQKFLQEELQVAKQRFALAQSDLQTVEHALAVSVSESGQQPTFPSVATSNSGMGSKPSGNVNHIRSSGKTKKSASSAPGQSVSKKVKTSATYSAAVAPRVADPSYAASGATLKQNI